MKEKQGEDYRLPRALQAGDSVLIYDLDKKAVVLELSLIHIWHKLVQEIIKAYEKNEEGKRNR